MGIFLVRASTGTVRAGGETRDVNAGDFFVHPPGEPHQLTHPGPGVVHYLLVADNPAADYWHYPDSGKWGFRAPRKILPSRRHRLLGRRRIKFRKL